MVLSCLRDLCGDVRLGFMSLFNRFLNAVVVFLTVIVGVLLVSVFVSPFFGVRPMNVVSDSMVPVFKTGDLLVSVKQDADPVAGDIIAYESYADRIVTHRVVSAGGDFLITKGDANEVVDNAPVDHNDVLGNVVVIVPGVGFLVNGLFLSIMSFVILILFALKLGFEYLPNFVKGFSSEAVVNPRDRLYDDFVSSDGISRSEDSDYVLGSDSTPGGSSDSGGLPN